MRTRSGKGTTARTNQNSGIAANRRWKKAVLKDSNSTEPTSCPGDGPPRHRQNPKKRARHGATVKMKSNRKSTTPVNAASNSGEDSHESSMPGISLSNMTMMKQLVEKIVEMQSVQNPTPPPPTLKGTGFEITAHMTGRRRKRITKFVRSQPKHLQKDESESSGDMHVSPRSVAPSHNHSLDADMADVKTAPAVALEAMKDVKMTTKTAPVVMRTRRQTRKTRTTRTQSALATKTTAVTKSKSTKTVKKKPARRGKPAFDVASLSSSGNMPVLMKKDGKPSKKANPKRQWALMNGPLVPGKNEPELGETINCVGYGVYCWFQRKSYLRKGQRMPAKREFRKLRCKDAMSQQLRNVPGKLDIPKPQPKRKKEKTNTVDTSKQEKSPSTVSTLKKKPTPKKKTSPMKKTTSPMKKTTPMETTTLIKKTAPKKKTVPKKKTAPKKKTTPKKKTAPEEEEANNNTPKSLSHTGKRKRSIDSGDDSETDVESPRDDSSSMTPALKKPLKSSLTPVKTEKMWNASATALAHPKKRIKTEVRPLAWEDMPSYIGTGSNDVGVVKRLQDSKQNSDMELSNPLLSSFDASTWNQAPPATGQSGFDNLIDYLANNDILASGKTLTFESGSGDNQFNRQSIQFNTQWNVPSFDEDRVENDSEFDSLLSFDDEDLPGLSAPMPLVRSRSREMQNVAPWMLSAACRSYMSSK